MYFACAAWPVEEPSIAPSRMPVNKRFWKRTERAFVYFGGVFAVLRYDNLKSAVKKILLGHQREETTRFLAFRSHWGFQSDSSSTPAEGSREGRSGRRRRVLPPEPHGAGSAGCQLGSVERLLAGRYPGRMSSVGSG